jgi:tetratricopeptide (TPR) repeat protein
MPRLLNRIGLIYQAQGELELALAAYQAALSGLKDVEEPSQISDRVLTLENMINLYQAQGQAKKVTTYKQQAMSALDAALKDQAVEGDNSRQADILAEIGEFYLTERRLDRAKQYFDRALGLSRRSLNEYSYSEINLLGSIVIAYEKEGLLEQTIPYKQRTAAVFEGMGLWENTASSLRGLGETYQAVGQFKQALDTYQQAIAIYQKAQEEYGAQSTSIARVLQQMGQTYETQGQLDQAEKIYQKALVQYQESGFPLGQIFVLERLATLYTVQGQSDQAGRYAQQAKTLRSQTQWN